MVKNSFVQQYKKKVTLLSQQGYGKKKVQSQKHGISNQGDNIMNKIIESIKHYWTDHKVIAGVVIVVIVLATIL